MVLAQRVALLHRRVLSPTACVRAFHASARAPLSCNRGASAARRTAAQLREFARANWHILWHPPSPPLYVFVCAHGCSLSLHAHAASAVT